MKSKMTDLIYAALLINNFSSNNKNQLCNAVRKLFFSLSYKVLDWYHSHRYLLNVKLDQGDSTISLAVRRRLNYML